jgi:mRNA interferase RelE/StbE
LAEKQLEKLEPEIAQRITRFMDERISPSEQPRVFAKKLSGPYEGKFRYRVGDYRVICSIEDKELVVLVIELAHRREVYR